MMPAQVRIASRVLEEGNREEVADTSGGKSRRYRGATFRLVCCHAMLDILFLLEITEVSTPDDYLVWEPDGVGHSLLRSLARTS